MHMRKSDESGEAVVSINVTLVEKIDEWNTIGCPSLANHMRCLSGSQ